MNLIDQNQVSNDLVGEKFVVASLLDMPANNGEKDAMVRLCIPTKLE